MNPMWRKLVGSDGVDSASEMTYIVSGGALNSTHSLTHSDGVEVSTVLTSLLKPKFHLLRHVRKRHARRVVMSVSCLSCVSRRACSNMADNENAVVLSCTSLVFCALDLHQLQEHFLEKSEVDMTTPVHAVETPLNTCRASRACRACRDVLVTLCCPISVTQHVTTFPCSKMHGLYSVSCRVVM